MLLKNLYMLFKKNTHYRFYLGIFFWVITSKPFTLQNCYNKINFEYISFLNFFFIKYKER